MKRIISLLLLVLITCIAPARKNQEPTLPNHPWAGKRIAYIGDSITDPRVGGGKITNYWKWLEQWLGSTPLVYGISGWTWHSAVELTDRLYKDHGQDVDGILIFLGTNDFNDDIPLGTWYDEDIREVERGRGGRPNHMAVRRHRTLSMDEGTLRGRINRAMQHLRDLYPTKQIVVMTPLHRSYAEFGKDNIQPDENYVNEQGLYIDDYVDAIREVSRVWSVPVIDLFCHSGLQPMNATQKDYFLNPPKDLLHPNTEGHRRMAALIYWQLNALPCTWE